MTEESQSNLIKASLLGIVVILTARQVYKYSIINWAKNNFDKIDKTQNTNILDLPYSGFRAWGYDKETKEGYMSLNFPASILNPSISVRKKNNSFLINK